MFTLCLQFCMTYSRDGRAIMARSYDAWMVGGLATMAVIHNTNVSCAHDTMHVCRYFVSACAGQLSLLCLGLCWSVEHLSASDTDIDDNCLDGVLLHFVSGAPNFYVALA